MTPNVEYNEELHQYKIDGVVVPSVTQIVKDVLNLDTSWLEAHPYYAERGTLIHNELAAFYRRESKWDDLSIEAQLLASLAGIQSPHKQAEILVYNTTHNYAGTADLIYLGEGKEILQIIDFKTGKNPNPKYCRAQLSLYRLALEDMGYDMSKCTLMVIYGSGQARSFEPMSWDEIMALKDDKELQETDEEWLDKVARLEDLLFTTARVVEQHNAAKEELKNLLIAKFEESGKSKYTGSHHGITYAPASTRKSLDLVKVREALGANIEEYNKETQIAATIRIKPFNEEN